MDVVKAESFFINLSHCQRVEIIAASHQWQHNLFVFSLPATNTLIPGLVGKQTCCRLTNMYCFSTTPFQLFGTRHGSTSMEVMVNLTFILRHVITEKNKRQEMEQLPEPGQVVLVCSGKGALQKPAAASYQRWHGGLCQLRLDWI